MNETSKIQLKQLEQKLQKNNKKNIIKGLMVMNGLSINDLAIILNISYRSAYYKANKLTKWTAEEVLKLKVLFEKETVEELFFDN